MCSSSAAFKSTQVSRQVYDSNDMSNNWTTEQEVRSKAIGTQKNKSEALSEETLEVYNGTKVS